MLNAGGLAVVGSRKACEEDLLFARKVGAKAASSEVIVISGGARGIDESAMLGAINNCGRVVGVMANNLLQATTSTRWRNSLMNDKLVLVSPFNPEAGFNAGNAMARNKYIYCMADSSLVVHSGKKGGTISGARENLRKKWVTLWVKPTSDKDAANDNLIKEGGHQCEDDIEKLDIGNLFSTLPMPDTDHRPHPHPATSLQPKQYDLNLPGGDTTTQVAEDSAISNYGSAPDPEIFYQLFLEVLHWLTAEQSRSRKELIKSTGLATQQLVDAWLPRAVDEGRVTEKTNRQQYQYQWSAIPLPLSISPAPDPVKKGEAAVSEIIYQAFLELLRSQIEVSRKDLKDIYGLKPSQLEAWRKQSGGKVEKPENKRPVMYQWSGK